MTDIPQDSEGNEILTAKVAEQPAFFADSLDVPTDVAVPDAVIWKYGPVADFRGMEIISWRHPTLPQPTPEEIERIVEEYRAYRAAADARATADVKRADLTGRRPGVSTLPLNNFRSLIRRRAAALERAGDPIGALKLRASLGE